MSDLNMIDHLFRHQSGKMVSVLTRIFGLQKLEIIEDAVQDTFAKAVQAWTHQMPDNPEAWLMQAAKNRVIDLFRKLNVEQTHLPRLDRGPAFKVIHDLFLDGEIADSQLRMIFTACHPVLNPKDQIAFALKTISGFSSKEIASALLLKEETIKKRLSRARKSIVNQGVSFQIPQGPALPHRLDRVLEVLYLIFNEGFHSNKKEILIRKELCGESLRLCKMLLANQFTNSPKVYALFGLMCFHISRIESKMNEKGEIVDLKNQDRKKWYGPLIALGNQSMNKAFDTEVFSIYHIEAAIAAEHLMARDFETTNWDKILQLYHALYDMQPSPFNRLNIAMVQLQRGELEAALQILKDLLPADLEQRAYLYHGAYAEYYVLKGEIEKALGHLDNALILVQNKAEHTFLVKKKAAIEAANSQAL